MALSTYIRVRRREWGLTQRDLAHLFGCQSSGHLSRIENGESVPSIELAIACKVLFDQSIEKLYPKLYGEAVGRLHERLCSLYAGIESKQSIKDVRKKIIIKRVIGRISS